MSGNGVDIAAVYQLLREVADRVIAHDARFTSIDNRFTSIDNRFADVDRQLAELRNGIADLRHTVTQYPRRCWVTAS